MKFVALCLFALVGAAVGKPVDEMPVKIKEPVPLIVSDYSSVAKDEKVVVPVEDMPAEVSTDAPATETPAADEEDSLVKEFNEEVKQEEKLLSAEASAVDEVRKEQEEVAVTTETADMVKEVEMVKEAEPVAVEAKSAVEESKEEEETTTEPAVAADSVGRVVRETEEVPKPEEASKTEEVEEVATSTDAPEKEVESRTEPEFTTVSS